MFGYWAFLEGDVANYWSVTRRHPKSHTPCSWNQQSYQGTILVSIDDYHTKRSPCPSRFHGGGGGGGGGVWLLQCQGSGWGWSANRPLFLCSHGPKTFHSNWIPLTASIQVPQTNPWSSAMSSHLDTLVLGWNYLKWSHLIFKYESRISPYNCHGRARMRTRAVEWLVDCCIQETGDRSGRGWPWTHQQQNAVGFNSGDGVAIGVGDNDY